MQVVNTGLDETFFVELERELWMFCLGNTSFFAFYKAMIQTIRKDPKLGLAAAQKALEEGARSGGRLVVIQAAVALGIAITVLTMARKGKQPV